MLDDSTVARSVLPEEHDPKLLLAQANFGARQVAFKGMINTVGVRNINSRTFFYITGLSICRSIHNSGVHFGAIGIGKVE